MNKARKTLLVFLLIVVQSALAITAGIAALQHVSLKVVPSGVSVNGYSIGGLDYSEAADKIKTAYNAELNQKSLVLQIENGDTYEIPFSQIDARVDGYATVQQIQGRKGLTNIPALFNTYFGRTRPNLQPVVEFNESKLRQELIQLSEKINTAPVDASIGYKDGIVVKKAETSGIALHVTNTVEVIRKQLSTDPWSAVILKSTDNYELEEVSPSVRMKDFDDIQQVLAEYKTDIMDKELTNSIQRAVNTINGVMLSSDGSSGSSFSFVECLKAANADFENDNEGYDQVASTLYAALLLAGLPKESITTRLPHKLSVDYIEPGLDAWISGTAGDLKFANPFSHKIALFASVEGEHVKVVIAGNIGDNAEKYEIRTETVQKYSPQIVYMEDKSLKPNEKIVLNPGKEGRLVNVYRNDELISTDKYDAEKKIVQIGSSSNWREDDK